MPLTDTAIKNTKPSSKPVRLFDGGGLYLEVSPAGGKLWRLKYRFDTREKRLSLGVYPEVSLKNARERRDEARKLLANGIDPGEAKKAIKQAREGRSANSFEVIAREWFAKFKSTWAPSHSERILVRLEQDVFPWLGGKPIANITPSMVLDILRRVEKRGALETAQIGI